MKTIRLLLASLFFATACFAMGGKVPPLTQCINTKSDANCKPLFGDPWFPNYKYPLYIVQNGVLVPNTTNEQPLPLCETPKKTCTTGSYTYQCMCYDPLKPTYDPLGYAACQETQRQACLAGK